MDGKNSHMKAKGANRMRRMAERYQRIEIVFFMEKSPFCMDYTIKLMK
jgi:hypothetical protein